MTEKKIARGRWIWIALLTIVSAFILLLFLAQKFDPVIKARKQMIERAKARYTPLDLQNKVVSLCDQSYFTNTWVDVEHIPTEFLSLSDIKPNFAIISHHGPGNCILTVFWGGGMRDWGVAVSRPGGKVDTNSIIASHWSLWSDGVAFFSN